LVALGYQRYWRGRSIRAAGEDAVEVGTLIRHQPPSAAEHLGDALHQRDVESGRALFGREKLKRRIGQRRPDLQDRCRTRGARTAPAASAVTPQAK